MLALRAILLIVLFVMQPSLVLAAEQDGPAPESTEAVQDEPAPPPLSSREYALRFLTDRDREALERGEYSRNDMNGSGLLGAFIGFGSGHAAQGRWGKIGWLYTLGEGASAGLAIGGATACNHRNDNFLGDPGNVCEAAYVASGLVGLLIFRIAETVDVIVYPRSWNARVRRAQKKLEFYQTSFQVHPNTDGGATASLSIRF